MLHTFIHPNWPMAYRVIGTGKPLLLIHGFGEDGQLFVPLAEYLSDTHQVVVPDLPGSGASALLRDTSMEQLADACAALMQSLFGEQPYGVIGHSMGGYTALALAERHPSRVNLLGLFHSSGLADSEEKKANRLKSIEFIQTHGGKAFLTTMVPGLFAAAFREQHPDLVARQTEASFQLADESLVAYYQAMMARPDRTQVLRSAEFPVLFVIGGEDQAVPAAYALEQAALPKQSFVCYREQVGHMGMLEDPEVIFAALAKAMHEWNV